MEKTLYFKKLIQDAFRESFLQKDIYADVYAEGELPSLLEESSGCFGVDYSWNLRNTLDLLW